MRRRPFEIRARSDRLVRSAERLKASGPCVACVQSLPERAEAVRAIQENLIEAPLREARARALASTRIEEKAAKAHFRKAAPPALDFSAIQEKLVDAPSNKARARMRVLRQVQDHPAASNLPSARSSDRYCAAIHKKPIEAPLAKACAALTKVRARMTAVRQVQDQAAASNLPSARSSDRYCAAIREKPIEAPLAKVCAVLTKVRARMTAVRQVRDQLAARNLPSARSSDRYCAAIQEKPIEAPLAKACAALTKVRARVTAVRQVQDQAAASNLPSARSSDRYSAAIQEKPIEAPLAKACAALTKVRARTRAISQVQAEAATAHLQSVSARARALGAVQAAQRTSIWPRATTSAVPFLTKKEAIRRTKRREARLNRLRARTVRRRLISSWYISYWRFSRRARSFSATR
jgi:hypothetical protein